MEIKTRYINEPNARAAIFYYPNNRPAIVIFSPSGDRLLTATINMPDVYLEPNEVIIKNYSENEGILESLINNGIVKLSGRLISTGFTNCEICTIIKED